MSLIRPEGDDAEQARAVARLVDEHPSCSSLSAALSALSPPPSALVSALGLLRRPSAALRLCRSALPLLPPPPSSPVPTILASKTLHLLLRSPRHLPCALSLARSLPFPLPAHSLAPLLRSLARSGRLRSAASLLPPSSSPSSSPSNSLLSALLGRGRTRAAAALFHRMLSSPSPAARPDLCTFNTLIRGLCLNSALDDAFRLFYDMPRRHRCPPDVITYNTLIDGLCRAGRVRTAHNLLDGMRSRTSPDISPNVVSYTTVIRGYCAKLLPDEAIGLFEEMIAAGLKPNKITYNTLIQGLCEARRMDLAKGIMEKADGNGNDAGFRPDACTFNTLIAAHCKMGKIDDALQVFDRMLELRVKRDSASYSTVIRALCENGEFRRAEELVDELLEKEVLKRRGGCVPLIAAYNPIFEYFCQNGKTRKAKLLFQQLLDRRGKLDFAAFKTLILGHCKEGAFEEGLDLLVSMLTRDLVPDAETYVALIEGFLQKRKMGFALNALEKMLNSGHRPSTSIFHLVLSGVLEKESYANEASNLVAVMLERKIRQNVDLSTKVVVGLFKNGLNERAFKIVRLLYDNGYYVKMEKLVEILCIEKKFLEAQELLLFSLDVRQKLDLVVFSPVLNGLCQAGRASEAFTLFYGMIDKGSLTAPSDCLAALRLALQEAGRLKEADFVDKQMRRAIT